MSDLESDRDVKAGAGERGKVIVARVLTVVAKSLIVRRFVFSDTTVATAR